MGPERSANALLHAAALLRNHPVLRLPEHLPGVVSDPVSGRAEPALAAVPLVLWLMDLLRPRQVVNYSRGRGLVHLACCQMAADLDAKNTCCHLSAPEGVSDWVQSHRQGTEAAVSVDLQDLTRLPSASVELITVSYKGNTRQLDWRHWRAPQGVILAYGAGCEELAPALGGAVLDINTVPILLAPGPEAPAVLREVTPDLLALLQMQARRLELEVLVRAQPVLISDPTALRQPPPRNLAEAEVQIARLISQQADDLDAVQLEFEARDAELAAERIRHQAALEAQRADLHRKDAIIAALEAHLEQSQPATAAPQSGVGFWRKG